MIHFGRLCILMFEKGSELPKGALGRMFKGRTVFLGDQVRDTWNQSADFEGLGAAMPDMADSRFLDAQSMQEGWEITTADAESAYLQAYLGGKHEVWVEVPYEYWEPSWKAKYAFGTALVCRLILALYGHVDSGGFWEETRDE